MTHFCRLEDLYDGDDLRALDEALTFYLDAHIDYMGSLNRIRRNVRVAIKRLDDTLPPVSEASPEKLAYLVQANSEMLSGPVDQIDLLGALETAVNEARAARRAGRETQ